MICQIPQLYEWFSDLASAFKGQTPDPDKIQEIVTAVERHFGTELAEYLGGGDNGSVFRAADGTVIKFTIDNKEAMLWADLGTDTIYGMNRRHKIAQLSSSIAGDTMIYVVQTDFVPHPVSRQQQLLIRQAIKDAQEAIAVKLQQMDQTRRGTSLTGRVSQLAPEVRYRVRTSELVKAFSRLATQDEAFVEIPQALMHLADEHASHLYDLQPDNFRIRDDGLATIVDPSIPHIMKASKKPEKLMFESRLKLSLVCSHIIV